MDKKLENFLGAVANKFFFGSLLIVLLFFISSPKVNADTGTTVTVPSSWTAAGWWVDTGIDVSVGMTINVTATGTWNAWNGHCSNHGPDGCSDQSWGDQFLNDGASGAWETHVPGLIYFGTLIGFIGTNPPQIGSYSSLTVAQRDAFIANMIVLGSNATVNATAPGTLWLGMNDDAYSGHAGDNCGSILANAIAITLSRLDLMTIQATGMPAGGTFSYNVALTLGANPPAISFVNGYTDTTNPNEAELIDPKNPDKQGDPTAGGLSKITAAYYGCGNTAQDTFYVPTFGMSCYNTALESDWGTPPKKCGKVKIGTTTYSGTITNPYGYPGTYCSSFIAVARLQGSGVLNSGQKIQYIGGTFVNVTAINGSDGTPVVAGQTVARDPSIIYDKGVYVTVDKINNNNPLLANDTGDRIVDYRLDLYKGVGKAVCNGFNNIISVGACNPEQNDSCPSKDIN